MEHRFIETVATAYDLVFEGMKDDQTLGGFLRRPRRRRL